MEQTTMRGDICIGNVEFYSQYIFQTVPEKMRHREMCPHIGLES